MRYLISIFALVLFFTTAGMAQVDSGTGGVHGYAFSRRPLLSGDDYADCVNRNDRKCLRVSPQEILSTVQVRHPNIRTVGELEVFIRNLVNVACPQGVEVRLARLLIGIGSRRVDANGWSRPFRPNEICLGDNNTGLIEFSLWCGNPNGDEVTFRQANPPVALPEVASQAIVPPADTVRILVADSATVVVAGVTESVVRDRAFFFPRQTDVLFTVVKDTVPQAPQRSAAKKGTNWPLVIGAAVVTGVVVGLIAYKRGQESVTCRLCKKDGGGPVNPPNVISFQFAF